MTLYNRITAIADNSEGMDSEYKYLLDLFSRDVRKVYLSNDNKTVVQHVLRKPLMNHSALERISVNVERLMFNLFLVFCPNDKFDFFKEYSMIPAPVRRDHKNKRRSGKVIISTEGIYKRYDLDGASSPTMSFVRGSVFDFRCMLDKENNENNFMCMNNYDVRCKELVFICPNLETGRFIIECLKVDTSRSTENVHVFVCDSKDQGFVYLYKPRKDFVFGFKRTRS